MYKKYTKKKIIKVISTKSNSKTFKNTKSSSLLIGCHASTVPSVLDGIKYIESIGGNAVQIYLGATKSADLKMKTKFTPEEMNEINRFRKKNLKEICFLTFRCNKSLQKKIFNFFGNHLAENILASLLLFVKSTLSLSLSKTL
jgi:hypothetical protein